jgi:hypothetical protein
MTIKQHVCIKICVKFGKSANGTLEMLREAFGELYLSWTEIFEWHSRFQAGLVSDEDDDLSGQSDTRKRQKMLKEKNSRSHSRRPLPNNL